MRTIRYSRIIFLVFRKEKKGKYHYREYEESGIIEFVLWTICLKKKRRIRIFYTKHSKSASFPVKHVEALTQLV